MPPSPMVSTADEGTMTIEPFSLMASYNMFIARKCSAVGLSWYDRDASSNEWAISTSAWPRMMRACFSRAACASRDIASCSSLGITTSRISTDCTVIPHGLERASISSCSSPSIRSPCRPTSWSKP